MPKKDAFTIPAGLKMEAGPDGISIENEGDIVLHSTLGQKLGRIRSTGGDIQVHVDAEVGSLEAPAGTVTARGRLRGGRIRSLRTALHGEAHLDEIDTDGAADMHAAIQARRVRGGSVTFDGGAVDVRVVEAAQAIRVGKLKINADILIAPTVTLDAGTTGKVKVVESRNDLGPHGVRPCLTLAELEEIGGNAMNFLAERGLKPLSGGTAAAPAADEEAENLSTVEPREHGTSEQVIQEISDSGLDEVLEAAAAAAVSDLPPLDPVHMQIVETLEKIALCYQDNELPPAIADLRDWVNRRDYAAVREGITNVWNQLLKFHQKQGLRIQPQVTTNFNALNSIVRKLGAA